MTKHRMLFALRRVRLNAAGYDDAGCYWGIGARLYYYSSEDGRKTDHIRAADRDHAKRIVRAKHPEHDIYFAS